MAIKPTTTAGATLRPGDLVLEPRTGDAATDALVGTLLARLNALEARLAAVEGRDAVALNACGNRYFDLDTRLREVEIDRERLLASRLPHN